MRNHEYAVNEESRRAGSADVEDFARRYAARRVEALSDTALAAFRDAEGASEFLLPHQRVAFDSAVESLFHLVRAMTPRPAARPPAA